MPLGLVERRLAGIQFGQAGFEPSLMRGKLFRPGLEFGRTRFQPGLSLGQLAGGNLQFVLGRVQFGSPSGQSLAEGGKLCGPGRKPLALGLQLDRPGVELGLAPRELIGRGSLFALLLFHCRRLGDKLDSSSLHVRELLLVPIRAASVLCRLGCQPALAIGQLPAALFQLAAKRVELAAPSFQFAAASVQLAAAGIQFGLAGVELLLAVRQPLGGRIVLGAGLLRRSARRRHVGQLAVGRLGASFEPLFDLEDFRAAMVDVGLGGGQLPAIVGQL